VSARLGGEMDFCEPSRHPAAGCNALTELETKTPASAGVFRGGAAQRVTLPTTSVTCQPPRRERSSLRDGRWLAITRRRASSSCNIAVGSIFGLLALAVFGCAFIFLSFWLLYNDVMQPFGPVVFSVAGATVAR